MKIGAMIAAAGKSYRMGMHKAVMPIFGHSALYFLESAFMQIGPQCIVITLPVDLIMKASRSPDFDRTIVTINRFSSLGYMGSIKTVVQDFARDVDGLFITPVDSPFIDPRLLVCMVNLAQHRAHLPTILVPYFRAQPGHPVYISRHFFSELKSYRGNLGLKGFIRAHQNQAQGISWPDQKILLNINAVTDLVPFRHPSASEHNPDSPS